VGAVSEATLSVTGLEDVEVLEMPVSEVMESPFPMVDADHAVDGIVKLLSKASPAVLVRDEGKIRGIVTRSDMLHFVMAR
jgi:cystathionine beta-synthase